jgi:hypothetical protein
VTRLFVSYKSEDSNLVRGIAERLLAAGVELWFAEKDIPLEQFPESDEEVERFLSEAIATADGAIVFTNDRWSRADWCRYEIRALLARIGDRERLLEIFIPREPGPHREFPALAGSPGRVFPGDARAPSPAALAATTRAVHEHFGLPAGPPELRWSLGSPLRLPRHGLTLDLGPFRRNLRFTRILRRRGRVDSRTLVCTAEIEGRLVTLDLYAQPFNSPAAELSVRQEDAANDREVYRRYRRFARRWLEQASAERGSRWEARGVHLVFAGGHSHLGLTYVPAGTDPGERLWERRYAIATAGDDPAERGDAGLVFGVHLDGTDAERQRQFYRYAPIFDAVAASARYEPARGAEAFALSLPIGVARAVWAGAASAVVASPASDAWPRPTLAVVALAGGFAAFDLVHFALAPLYRRLLWTWQEISDDAAPRGVYERLSTELVFWLFALPAQLVVYVWRALGSRPSPSLAGRLWGLAAVAGLAVTWPLRGLAFAPVAPRIAMAIGAGLGALLALVGGRLYVAAKRARVAAA